MDGQTNHPKGKTMDGQTIHSLITSRPSTMNGQTNRGCRPDHPGFCTKPGSSTARAPAQAGEAGSSPAPVSKLPWSTPTITEVTDADEKVRIIEFWRPKWSKRLKRPTRRHLPWAKQIDLAWDAHERAEAGLRRYLSRSEDRK
jgi:hypothetical protein